VPKRESVIDGPPARPAFESLYAQWSEPVYRYLARLLGARPVVDDLFQDTWMKAIEHRGQLRDAERFGPWIFRIARNLAFNQRRRGRRRTQVYAVSSLSVAEGQEPESLIESDGEHEAPTPRDAAIDGQRRQLIEAIMEELTDDAREMIHLRYYEQLTLAEVAQVMDVPLGTVCTKVHRSLRTIRRRLERQGHRSLETI